MEKLKALEDKKVSEFQTKLKLQENIYDQTKGLNNRGLIVFWRRGGIIIIISRRKTTSPL